ncbi:hypothetical protein MBRA1_000059 [Malassezia brasiliensis]|uniref:GPI transamidase subunit PIG-U n=1 Tax=Malassezia brasiliensis TaxID=1821822 RepID=A0AAF0DP55_9BASI|nr:hypothetical protein MBRA1_000059 [Malassezia brasiliensis]
MKGVVAACAVAVGVRVLLSWWTQWGEDLTASTALATSMDRIELLREMHALLTAWHVDAHALWASLSVHHSPLLLVLGERFIQQPVCSAVLWIVMDVATGLALAAVVSRRAKQQPQTPFLTPAAVAAWYVVGSHSYWLNPYTIACCAAKSTATLRALLVAGSVLFAVFGASWGLAIAHTLGALLFLSPAMLTPALVLLGADSHTAYGRWRAHFGLRRSDAWWMWMRAVAVRMTAVLALGLLASLVLSRDMSGQFVRSVYGSRLLLDDLAPSSGLAWYFFVQMFEHFKTFYVLVVNVHMWAYMVPITIQFRSDPLFAVTVLYGIVCLFQNYPSLNDTALFIALWSVSAARLADCTSKANADLRHPMVTTLLVAYATLLMPAFHYLWLYAGSANANFSYAVNLVHALGVGSLVLDAVWAWSHERWERERPAVHAPPPDAPPTTSGVVRRRIVVQR